MFFAFGRPARTDPDHLVVTVEGRGIRVAIRRNERARRYALRVPPTGGDPVLTMPTGGRFSEALAFAQAHAQWIAGRLSRRPERIAFAHGAEVPLRGETHRVFHVPGRRGTVWREIIGETAHLCVAGDAAHVARRLTDYLKAEARRDLERAVARHTETIGVTARSVKVKDTKTRWGSCSADGNLAFSWRIVLAPPHVLDYLAAHEVAHLKEMNHSVRFWRVVRGLTPDTEAARAWLKRYGSRLHAYG